MYGVGKRVFQGSNQYFVDLHKTGSWFLCSTTSRKFNPSLVTTGRRQNRTLIRKLFLSLLFCTNQVICFCTIFSFKKFPSLLPTGKRILLPHFEKKLFPLTYTQWERSNFKSVSKIFCKKITPCENKVLKYNIRVEFLYILFTLPTICGTI